MIKHAPIDGNKIRNLIADIQNNVKNLEILASLSLEEFKKDNKNYGLAEHYLRRSLEGVLTAGTHILSRLPVKTKDYQEVILSLGKEGVVPKDFAEKNRKLAGYRNRLVHMYWEVSEDEMYEVINTHTKDLDLFCSYFQEFLKNSDKFNVDIR